MKQNRRYYPGLVLVVGLWVALALWAWFKPADSTSLSERRPLAQPPKLTAHSLLQGDYMRQFASYAVDQFPLRDDFRHLKALASRYAFRQLDNNGLYLVDGTVAAMEHPLDTVSVNYAVDRFTDLYDSYLHESNRILFAIVPDKGYYLAQPSGHLSMDYEALFETMQTNLPWAEFVDLTGALTADSYYRTDTHWRQEALFPVAQLLSEALGIPAPQPEHYTAVTLPGEFFGVYAGQSALALKPDELNYLTWQGWDRCTLYTHDNGKTAQVYDLTKQDSNDRYDIFLSGAAAVQTVENPNAASHRELIVFRDSFGSSLVPLLVDQYSTITIIDTRYISPKLLSDYVNFQGKDVLMLYSTLVLNSSDTLKK